MRAIYRFILIAILSLSAHTIVQGQNILLQQTHESGIYQKGQKIRFTLFLKDRSGDSVSVKISRNHIVASEQIRWFSGDTLILFNEAFSTPSSVIVEVKTRSEKASLGAIVDPGKFNPGTIRPKDFDKFWTSEKKKIRALPFEVKKVLMKESGDGFTCFDMELNCVGPKPARGYYAMPENAKAGSLPIVLLVHAAGVKGSWCRSEPGNALRYAKMGTLCFDLNAHGMLNGQPESYYADLENGELKNYYLQGIETRSDVYFRAMYERLIRTLDFLKLQPEWDGKRILVIGESQGGGQALAAAGLDKKVSAVIATVPAMCDWGGTLVGRQGGWPQPFESGKDLSKMKSALPYFDDAHILKGSKATILTEIGLIDVTCPASSVFAAVNQAKGKKIIYVVPYREHHAPANYQKEMWENNVNKHREEFIRDFIK